MKTTINVEEVKQTINYPSLAQEIVTLSKNGSLNRQNLVAALLDPLKDSNP